MSHTAWPGLHSTQAFLSLEELAERVQPSAFFTALDEATRRATDTEIIRDAFARAVGHRTCPCGDAFEFTAESTIDDYAALNRWLGHHGRCTA